MISLQELNPKNYPLTEEQQKNLNKLLIAINKVRVAYGKPMIVTSGIRSMEDHLRIYKEKGITDIKKIPMESKHLIGAAVDILDKSGALYDWCKTNENILIQAGLWLEERQGPWQHFQCEPPKSGKRWFMP